MEFLLLLGAAFLGGLILNITPCLLPVLPLKVLHFLKLHEGGKGHQLLHGAMYAAGIILSFVALGGIVIGIQVAGGFAHWGFHFQSPIFCAAMAAVMGAIGLHLTGLGRILLRGIKRLIAGLKMAFTTIRRISRKNDSDDSKKEDNGHNPDKSANLMAIFLIWVIIQGKIAELVAKVQGSLPLLGSFLAGALTTLLGSACCGPFLGYAMGLALGAHWLLVLATFTLAGVGMATPYMILTCWPRLLAWVPKTGRWVRVFKIVAGCGMFLTAAWLLLLAL